MQLRTYTGLWKVEKRLYKFYDIALPYPVSIKQVGIFLAALLPWIAIVSILRIPLGTSWGFLIWVAPPFLIAWYSNRPVAEGKGLWDYIMSQLKYLVGPRDYAALTVIPAEPPSYRIKGDWWRSDTSKRR